MKHLMMKIVYLIVFIAISIISTAQPLPYEFTILNETYESFDNGTSLTSGFEWDDEYYSAPIGFSFTYMDSTYEYISAIGIFGGLGAELILGEYDEGGKYDIMCPALIDLVDAPGAEESDISFITIGEPGNRIFKLQWSNCSVYGDKGPTASRVELQVWLHEATNSIDFKYGTTSDFDIQDYLFLNGIPVYLGNNCEVEGTSDLPTNIWTLTGNAATADIQSFQSLNEFVTGVFLEDYPTNGLVYHFEGFPDNISTIEPETLIAFPTMADAQVTLSGIEPNSILTVFDLTGKVIVKTPIQSSVFALDINHWTSGLYLFEVKNDASIRTAKIIRK
jgi:hypothetical protein